MSGIVADSLFLSSRDGRSHRRSVARSRSEKEASESKSPSDFCSLLGGVGHLRVQCMSDSPTKERFQVTHASFVVTRLSPNLTGVASDLWGSMAFPVSHRLERDAFSITHQLWSVRIARRVAISGEHSESASIMHVYGKFSGAMHISNAMRFQCINGIRARILCSFRCTMVFSFLFYDYCMHLSKVQDAITEIREKISNFLSRTSNRAFGLLKKAWSFTLFEGNLVSRASFDTSDSHHCTPASRSGGSMGHISILAELLFCLRLI